MKYQNCIFDLYGTLVDLHTDELHPRLWKDMTALYRKHGAVYTAKELQEEYFRIAHEIEQEPPFSLEEYPEINIEEVFRRLFFNKGVNASHDLCISVGEHLRESSLEYIRLYDGAAELLKTLRRCGQGVWLLSNAQRIFTAPELRSLGIENLFDGIYLSSDYGCKKPASRFFNILLQEQHIPVESAIMIGNDAVCDIEGAQAMGLHTLYIRTDVSPEEPLPKADYSLREMDMSKVQEILTQK